MRVVGIDPGLSGAIAVLDEDSVDLFDIPTWNVGEGSRRTYNVPGLVDLLRSLAPATFVVEHQSPRRENPAVSFKVGLGYGILLGILCALELRHFMVSPQGWQRAMYAGTGKSGKDRSIEVASRLWPNIRITRHDQADALLIAEYGRRLERGEWK